MLRSTTVAMLFGRVGAASLAMKMAEIKATAGFDPREPPQHRTVIDVGVYVEHLLDVSNPSSPPAPRLPRITFSESPAPKPLDSPPHPTREGYGGGRLLVHAPSRAAVTHNNVSALCYRSLDTQVSIEEHTFDMDFYLTQEWLDGRNFSALFSDENLVEQEPDSCDEPRSPARSAPNPHLPSLSPH